MVEAVAEIGDQLEPVPGFAEDGGVDVVRHRGHQHIGHRHRLGEIGLAHRHVVKVQAGIEQLAHACLDNVRQLAGDDHQGLVGFRHSATWPF